MKLGLLLMAVGYAFLWLGLYAMVNQAMVSSAIAMLWGLGHVVAGYWILFRKQMFMGEL